MIIKKCIQCNKDFGKNTRQGAKFCNRKCYAINQKKTCLGVNNNFYGKKHTEETKKLLSLYSKNGICGRLGKKTSLETIEKIRKAQKGIPRPYCRGANHWNWQGGRLGKWAKENKERVNFITRRRKYRLKNSLGNHSFDEWEQLKKDFGYMCLCCKRKEPEIKLTEDHIIPLSKNGSNYIENIQPLCQSCNSRKKTKETNYKIGARL